MDNARLQEIRERWEARNKPAWETTWYPEHSWMKLWYKDVEVLLDEIERLRGENERLRVGLEITRMAVESFATRNELDKEAKAMIIKEIEETWDEVGYHFEHPDDN